MENIIFEPTPRWVTTDDDCPSCDGLTQVYVDGEYSLAERCGKCKWQVHFEPDVKRVKYGTRPPTS